MSKPIKPIENGLITKISDLKNLLQVDNEGVSQTLFDDVICHFPRSLRPGVF